jgi:CHAT domain-containing protein
VNRLALVLALVALACASVAQDAGVTAKQLQEQIRGLRLAGRYEEASDAALELVALRRGDCEAKPYEIADAERLVESLMRISSLPAEAQRELAYADTLRDVDERCRSEGRYADAADAIEEQLEIRRRLLGDMNLDVATSLDDLAMNLTTLGDYTRAEELHRQAIATRRQLLGDQHPDVAESVNNLAALFYARADYSTAAPLFREAMEMWSRVLGDEDPLVATSLNNLAAVSYALGDYAAAESLSRGALAMWRKLLGSENTLVATSLNNLAALLHVQGDHSGAESLYREALATWRNCLGEESAECATTLCNLAGMLGAKGDHESAEVLLREALAMRRKLLGNDHLDVATNLGDLGVRLHAQRDYAGAEQFFRESLAMLRKLLGDENPHVARTLRNLAFVLRDQGHYADAERLFRESMAMRRRLLGDQHPDVVANLSDIAVVLCAQGDYAGAEPVLADAARAYDAARTRAGTGLKRAMFLASPYPHLAAVKMALGRAEEAWPAAEKGQARLLADLLLAAEERNLSPAESATEDSMRRILGKLERELAVCRRSALEDSTGESASRAENARDALLAAESEWSAFQQELAAKYPLTEGEIFPLARVQAALPEDAALIGWLDVRFGRDDGDSWCYAIRSRGPVAWERTGSRPVEEGLRAASARTRSFGARLADPASPDAVVRRESHQLWLERIAPLRHALEGVEAVIVVPSGAMLGVPVETLVDDEGPLVGDKYAVSYAPSATLYAWLVEQADREGGSGALLVGDPPYNPTHLAAMEGEAVVALASVEQAPGTETLRSALAGNEEVLRALPRLPWTRDEVASVASVCGPSSLLLGPEATEQELVRMADSGELATLRTIHIATHAFVDDESPERSALVLSQVGLPDPLRAATGGARIYDGLVSAKEIVREWDLDADLVALSACETGLGREVAGEGYVGFAHAFLQAGARCLLVSLWNVEDRATSLLMRRFYENWLGRREGAASEGHGGPMSKADALREAKSWLRRFTDENGHRPYEHPFFWSAFVLIGDPG